MQIWQNQNSDTDYFIVLRLCWIVPLTPSFTHPYSRLIILFLQSLEVGLAITKKYFVDTRTKLQI